MISRGAAGKGSCDGDGGRYEVVRRSDDHQNIAEDGDRADEDGDDEAGGGHLGRGHLERRDGHRVGLTSDCALPRDAAETGLQA